MSSQSKRPNLRSGETTTTNEPSPQMLIESMENPTIDEVHNSGEEGDFEKEDVGKPRVKKRSRKRSEIWLHFDEFISDDNTVRARCKYCSKSFAAHSSKNGTKNLNFHLPKCEKYPENKTKGIQTQIVLERGSNEEGQGRLKCWTLNQGDARDALSYMIIVDELPFKFVEHPGFRHFLSIVCPDFNLPSRFTLARDCYQLYLNEKTKLQSFLKHSCQRVCVTTDTWTSIKKINYMTLTAHFIDKDWKLRKKILNFCPISGHKGEIIGRAVESCLIDWDLDGKLYTITVDNASSNDVACKYVKQKMAQRGGFISDGNYLHMRCIAHIINLIVVDGLKESETSVDRVRAVVRFVRQSPARLKRFKECVQIEKIESKALLSLDVVTRWNSTYLMLNSALKFERAFERFGYVDPYFRLELNDIEGGHVGVPIESDWANVRRLSTFLESFYEVTLRVSGTSYVTANSFFFEIAALYDLLCSHMSSSDVELCNMATSMKAKYDKYWGNIDKMNMMIYIAALLDPRVKLVGLKLSFIRMYGTKKGEEMTDKIETTMSALFEEYRKLYAPIASQSGQTGASSSGANKTHACRGAGFQKNIMEDIKRMRNGADNGFVRTESDRYLNEEMAEDESDDFDILKWWQVHGPRFPVLSCLTRDVLAIPISTVASESAFSTGGRHLDSFRSSLTPKTVQSLICAQDWLKSTPHMIDVEVDLEELDQLEKELSNLCANDVVIDV